MAHQKICRENIVIELDKNKEKSKDDCKEDCDKICCKWPLVIRQNPPGSPPIVPAPFPPIAYGLATIDTANNVLYVGGLQGFLPNGDLAPTVQERVELAYASIFAIARFYGASPLDILRLDIWVNADAPIAIAQFPGLTHTQRFNAIRDITNAIQAPIYGNFAPARSILGTTDIVLEDVIEIVSIFLLPAKVPVCPEKPKYFKAIASLPFASHKVGDKV